MSRSLITAVLCIGLAGCAERYTEADYLRDQQRRENAQKLETEQLRLRVAALERQVATLDRLPVTTSFAAQPGLPAMAYPRSSVVLCRPRPVYVPAPAGYRPVVIPAPSPPLVLCQPWQMGATTLVNTPPSPLYMPCVPAWASPSPPPKARRR